MDIENVKDKFYSLESQPTQNVKIISFKSNYLRHFKVSIALKVLIVEI